MNIELLTLEGLLNSAIQLKNNSTENKLVTGLG
jgi:hypothetical protein